jgi:protein-tyrosine phosphatase
MSDHESAPIDHSRRIIAVQGAYNVRDLGGLPVGTGGETAFGHVFRGDFPRWLSEAEHAIENRLPIESVVDLRRAAEAGHERVDHERHGLAYTASTLVTDQGTSWSATYADYLRDGPDEVVAAVAAVLEGAKRGVYFHCAAGKDRTGVIAALLLDVLDVARADIVADFMLTDLAIEPILDRLRRTAAYGDALAGRSLDQHRPQATKIESFLEWLSAEQGGARRWLVAHGLPAGAIDRFRALMIAPTAD